MNGRVRGVLIHGAIALAGCSGPQGQGAVDVRLEGDDGIGEGLEAGSEEGPVDGWSVSFDEFVVVIGQVELGGGGPTRSWAGSVAVDLAAAGESTRVVLFDGLAAGAWTDVAYRTVNATGDTTTESVDSASLTRMVEEGCTYLLRGSLNNAQGERCLGGDAATCAPLTSVNFDLCVPAETQFGPCQSDTGVPGLVVTADGTAEAELTIHGDHMLFNSFPAAAEGEVVRRGQWMVNADANEDGTLTRSDLESFGASALGRLLPTDVGDGHAGYSLGGAPQVDGHPIASAWDFLRALLMTQGHFQGEGECPFRPIL